MSLDSPASGITSLETLISTLKTRLDPRTFVFLTLPETQSLPASLFIQMTFREAEGLTVITTQESAIAHDQEYSFPCKMITLDVHSSLEAIGFIASVGKKLTERGIGVNPVSGFFHDHCFVPLGKETEAIEALEAMAKDAKKTI